MEGPSTKSIDEIDWNTILQVPDSVRETSIVNSQSLGHFLATLSKIQESCGKSSKLDVSYFHKILSFCLNLLELEIKEDPLTGPISDLSCALYPMKLIYNLRPREEADLKEK